MSSIWSEMKPGDAVVWRKDGANRPAIVVGRVPPGSTPADLVFGADRVPHDRPPVLEATYVVVADRGVMAWVHPSALQPEADGLRLLTPLAHEEVVRQLRRVVGEVPAEEPEAESYDDTESAYGNGHEVGTWETANRSAGFAREALGTLGAAATAEGAGQGSRRIVKVGLVLVANGELLVVRKRGQSIFILPGGKPEGDESHVDALRRELLEELGCGLEEGSEHALATFEAEAAYDPGCVVEVVAFGGRLAGAPRPSSEIEEVRWFRPGRDDASSLATSVSGQILPWLEGQGLISPVPRRVQSL